MNRDHFHNVVVCTQKTQSTNVSVFSTLLSCKCTLNKQTLSVCFFGMVAGLFTGLPETIKSQSDGSTPASSTMLPSAPQVCVVWGKIGKSRATDGPYIANKLLWVVDVLFGGNTPILPGCTCIIWGQTCPCVFGSILKGIVCVWVCVSESGRLATQVYFSSALNGEKKLLSDTPSCFIAYGL